MEYNVGWAKRKSDQIWGARSGWSTMYDEAYDYAVPMRRPGRSGAMSRVNRLFDMTAPMSAMYFAGNLQRDLFPAGQPTFVLETGPLAKMAIKADEVKAWNRELSNISELMHPFFLAGDWDTALHEACIDLSVGTAAILPVKGTPDNPVRFVCLPFDQLALGVDAYGSVNFVSWKQVLTIEQVAEAFPNGRFPDGWSDKLKSTPNGDVTLYQEWWAESRGWGFGARIDSSLDWITWERTRTQPIAVPRYYRVPGEAYGRGVILTALPSIKTVNKAQELALKSTAISMLGLWGYRAGGTFNPNTAKLAPGEFWPMQSTGGVLGPDVQRLDTAGGRIDVGKMVIGDLQAQIKQAMFDTRLPEYQGTPRSASEMTARMQQKMQIHIGAFGRLVNELMPIIVPRVAEILFDFRILPQVVQFNDLLLTVKVRSPMQAALNADRLAAIANYHDIVVSFAGPERARLYADIDKILERVAEGLQIEKDLIPDENRRAQLQQEIDQAQQQQLAAIFAQKAAAEAPKAIANAAMADPAMNAQGMAA